MKDQIRAFILERFVRAQALHPGDDDPLIESGVIDSLGVLELVSFLESTFDIEMAEEDLVMRNFRSINRIASLVEGKQQG